MLMQVGPEALRSMKRSLGQPPSGIWIYVALGLAALAIVLLVAHIVNRRLQRSRQGRRLWREFVSRLESHGITPAESELLRTLVERQAPSEPLDLITKAEVFEAAVDAYLRSLSSGGGKGQLRNAAGTIRSARTKLGLEEIGPGGYHSTRQLPKGQEITLTIRDDEQTVTASAKVGQEREDLLELAELEPAKAAFKGKTAQLAFFHGDGAFRFRTTLVDVDEARKSCLATHTLALHKAKGTRVRRVRVERPISFRAATEAAGIHHEGTLQDVSTGGACLAADPGFRKGDKLVLEVRPSQYHVGKRAAAQENLEERTLTATIVEKREAPDGRSTYHLEFLHQKADEEQYLGRLISLLEVAARRRWARE